MELSLGTFQSHAGSVHGLQVHGGLLYTCSEDNTARAHCLKVSGSETETVHTFTQDQMMSLDEFVWL